MLDNQYYFQSMLQEAYNNKMISDAELEKIQLQVVELLNKQVESFTGGESSSVRTETAQNIMQSICYCISIYLKSISDIDFIITQLRQKPLAELYQKGRKLIDRQIKCAKVLLHAVSKNKIQTNNYAYNETIDNGLPPFFSCYQPDFGAHETPGSIDYPLCIDKMDLLGIEYIYGYLQKLLWENQFCANFTSYRINCVLRAYDKHFDDLLINIFERVFINALGCVLSDSNIFELNIAPDDIKHLQTKVKMLSKDELDDELLEAAKKLFLALNIKSELVQTYIIEATKEISTQIRNAIALNQLDTMFISYNNTNSQQVIHYEDGERMVDEVFCGFLDKLEACKTVEEKINLIHKNVHCLTDLVDMFESECILENEYSKVIESLDEMIIALLYKRQSFYMGNLEFLNNDEEKDWEVCFRQFFTSMEKVKQSSIIKLAERIKMDLEEI